MEEKLYGAAVVGAIQPLLNILREDPHILHRIAAQNSISTPLHVASLLGHVGLVRALLQNSPDLAGVVDQRRRSALHLAAENGQVEVVRVLVELEDYGKDMCTAVDEDGKNPLHVAAMKGRLDVLTVLMANVGPDVAQATVENGRTILHLCVMYRQRETLKLLMESECQDLINAVDEWGNTVLHLAVANKQFEIVKYLASFRCKGNNENMKLNVKNGDGCTALDILLNSRIEEETEYETNRIKVFLLKLKAKRANNLIKNAWLTEKRESLLIVTTLIAAMAFQAGLSPPGGVLQDDENPDTAGQAVVAYTYHHYYPYFLRVNTVGFVASLSTILLLISDLPFRKKIFMWFLVLVMWVTITSMAFTYAFAIISITPGKDRVSLIGTIVVAVIVWCGVIFVLLIVHSVKLIKMFVEEEVEKHHEYKAALRSSQETDTTTVRNSLDSV